MSGKSVIAICQWGGEFEADPDGLLQYKGGDAHAMEIEDKMKFKDFKVEVAEMFNCNLGAMSIKYFLPGNKKTLISISNDKDFKRMVKFHSTSDTAELYVATEEVVEPVVSNMPGSRGPNPNKDDAMGSSRTTLSEAEVQIDASAMLHNVFGDMNEPGLFDATFDVVGDTNHNEAQMEEVQMSVPTEIPVPSEMPVPISIISSYEKHTKAAQQWQNNITGVGQRFNSVHEFRETLRKYAIAHQFAFVYKKNDGHRVTVKCKAEGCPWRIHASRLTTTPLICIKKMNPTHTCEGDMVRTGHKATRSWIASIIKEKVKVFPEYKPKDIVNDIKQEYGIELNYFQAWRGKEIAKEQLQGSYKEAYGQLPYFCDKIMETNPGSLATFTTKEDSSFHRLFVSFHASLYAFQHGCRPLLFLDSTIVKSKYQGALLAATAADGDDGVFPVAFAVVDRETDDNWRWFLEQVKTSLTSCRGLTFVADREKGLREPINEIFQNEEVYHGFCIRHLSEKLIRDLKGQFSQEIKRLMVEDFHSAANSATPEGFQRAVERIKHISLEAHNWVMQSEPVHWANAFFPGSRYHNLTSNYGEVLYSWICDANELPIIQMVDLLRSKITEIIFSRRAEANQWMSRLTPSMEERLEKERHKAHNLQVLVSIGNRFEVRGETIETVSVDNGDCTCKSWQLTGIPCCHAIAVINCLRRDTYDYCSRFFTTENYKLTYSESIYPILDGDGSLQKGNSKAVVTVTPPATRRPPGRPTKRIGYVSRKRPPKCSKCKKSGHRKSNCKELLLEG